jgi:protein-S-isoprenylcysteine O-methyltransferase Ste14
LRIGNRARAAAWAAMVALAAAGPLLDQRLGLGCPAATACRLLGLALLAVVLRGAAVTGRYLAVYGHRDPCRGPRGVPDQLVDRGPYSCMRHPMHFFLAWFPASIALLEASPAGLATALAEAALVLALAVALDEKDAEARLGQAYRDYRRRVPAFNPSPSCLAKALGPRPPKPKCSNNQATKKTQQTHNP